MPLNLSWNEPSAQGSLPSFNEKSGGSEPAQGQIHGVGLPVAVMVWVEGRPGVKGSVDGLVNAGGDRTDNETRNGSAVVNSGTYVPGRKLKRNKGMLVETYVAQPLKSVPGETPVIESAGQILSVEDGERLIWINLFPTRDAVHSSNAQPMYRIVPLMLSR